MPVVTKELSKLFAESKFRPKCHKCGRFIGVGGYYDVILTDEGYEEFYSTCKQHSEHNQDSEKDCEKKK